MTFDLRILLMTLVAALLVSACGYSESTPTETGETIHSPMKAPTPLSPIKTHEPTAASISANPTPAIPAETSELVSTPPATPTPGPTAMVASAGTPTPEVTPEPSATPTPIPLEPHEPPDKSEAKASPAERTTEGAPSEWEGSGQGTVYTWEDGDRTLRVVLQNDLVVQVTAANTPDDVVVVKGAGDSIVQKQARHGQNAGPVFRSESGGGLMTLPGGVLLALDPEWDQAMVESFFSRNNISTDRTSELDFLDNGFLVEAEPGFPSLELANALAAQDGVVISSPNWWREVEAK